MKWKISTSAMIWILRGQTMTLTFLYPVTVHVDVGLVEPSPVVNVSWVNPTVCSVERGLGERTGNNNQEPHGDPALHPVSHRHDWWWRDQSELPPSSTASSLQAALNYNSMSITQFGFIGFSHTVSQCCQCVSVSVLYGVVRTLYIYQVRPTFHNVVLQLHMSYSYIWLQTKLIKL